MERGMEDLMVQSERKGRHKLFSRHMSNNTVDNPRICTTPKKWGCDVLFFVFFLTTHDHPFIAIFVDGKSWQHQKIPQGPPEAVHAEWILAPGWAASLHSSHPRRQELADGKHWDSAIFYCFPPIFRV
jgi:hypothetical protein